VERFEKFGRKSLLRTEVGVGTVAGKISSSTSVPRTPRANFKNAVTNHLRTRHFVIAERSVRIAWPQRSSDLAPLDFFLLWPLEVSHSRDIYRNKRGDLAARIIGACETVQSTPRTSARVAQNSFAAMPGEKCVAPHFNSSCESIEYNTTENCTHNVQPTDICNEKKKVRLKTFRYITYIVH
jgi:hypothetical protein